VAEKAKTLFVLGLGSNLGDRVENLRAAAAALGDAVVVRSGIYETPPAGGPQQPDYLNAALAVQTTLEPRALLQEILAIERDLGRVRPDPVRWGPRTIDIDILWWSGGAHDDGDLVIPHPRLQERIFALQPLLDVAPDARDPHTSAAYVVHGSINKVAETL
jgi:2-amino-4-hydroxy-6-hydroxymethyldihydropteridine diphosphokinase